MSGTPLARLLDPDLSLRVALTLLHFLWQGALLAAVAALASCCPSRGSSRG